ncbi:hypothetical protein [Thauera sinica]|uniref:Uncharacterized protein n=1 Tax=Thauera sinica TaxID=2665146 RepID=A0ABW1AUG4_9RHOO|nr:hypothetical protein [Thauera sp. K11]ATE61942.1 hypothetical protein CCZ27_19985 [Thauera sp. K11]
MADQENIKPLTDHFDDVAMRLCQARAVLRSLTENCQQDEEGIHFGDVMSFEEVSNTLWAIDALLGQAKDFCNDGFRAACAVRFPNLAAVKAA